MGNKYYQPGAERTEKVGDLFATIAPRYDLINDLQSFGLHRGWKRRLVRLAAPRPGERALDLCCGTGDIAFALARCGAEVVGLDFSEAMLAVARERGEVQRPKSPSPLRCGAIEPEPKAKADKGQKPLALLSAASEVLFIQGDAQQVPFPDNHFDIVTVGYGLRNLESWEAGLTEMQRVAKPGGRLLVLDFGKPENRLWRGVYLNYLRWIVPMFGKVFCRDSATYAYIFESLRDYPAQRGIALKMRELNCTDVCAINLLGGVMSINYGRKAARAAGA
jgi:demethylmenaquinone methyltransferase/2-methoxy-6-polyprenyl-1,4-benzoquinol methylase